MKSLLFLLNCLSFYSCTLKEKQKKHQVTIQHTSVKTLTNYDSCKNAVLLNKQKQKPFWGSLSKTEKEKFLPLPLLKL
jgi:hypothetical protein